MSLTMANTPFGPASTAQSNIDLPKADGVLYFEDFPRRVRAVLGGHTVADSTRVKLLHETGHLPVYYFPYEDVDFVCLEPTPQATHCPVKGDATYWTVRAGQKTVENAAWAYPEPVGSASWLSGYLAWSWNAMDAWYEEDEQVFVHPRDPYTRIEVLASSRHVRVSLDGELLAESAQPIILFETGLPPRFYLPGADVDTERLQPSTKRTRCPYKGVASYWSLSGTGEAGRDVVWTYRQPLAEAAKVAGLLCFYNERVDLDVDGQRQPRPVTPFA